MDEIWLHGVACRARLGVPAAERRRPQRVLVDVGLEFPTGRAAAADDFRLTVDYKAVETAVIRAVESKERRLLETLAEDAARAVLAAYRRLSAVSVRARKRPAAMPRTAEVVVSIRRSRR